jgi:outer membrane biogenesis lipoprotein LolB
MKKLLLMYCILLSGCTVSTENICTAKPWVDQKTYLSKINNYLITGKANIKYDNKAEFINFKLIQENKNTDIIITGPLMIPIGTIKQNNKSTTIKLGDNNEQELKILMKNEFGFYISPKELGKLIRGIPLSGKYKTNNNNYPLSQDLGKYKITWNTYGCIDNKFAPKKITITSNNTKITLVINST